MLNLAVSLATLFGLSVITGQAVGGALTGSGWELERDVAAPSYALTEPASTNLNIDAIVLLCEQGPTRRGLQLRLYPSGTGPLAPQGTTDLKDHPTIEFSVDGVSYAVDLLFADDFVIVADSADGALPLLSAALLDVLQSGRRMELRFDLVQEVHGQAPSFDGSAVVNLQAGQGGAAVAAVRRCTGEQTPRVATSGRAPG